ncbi:uncharacterized protein LOC5577298 [Aedes aegypti]|uniref:Ionotropic receptor 75a N-terminal domain-containing protein n=3 Tax=Aedes aegypti TaxID=7159 RepID=A0A903UU83_AEDAE
MRYTNISSRFINIAKSKNLLATEVLPQGYYGRTACIFDYSCNESLVVLQKFSVNRYFNITYSWLFLSIDNSIIDEKEILHKLDAIQMNSDVTVGKPIIMTNETNYELEDVHTIGKHLCKDVFHIIYGKWNPSDGLVIDRSYNRYYARGNFGGIQLRGATIIDRDNVTGDDVDNILSVPGSEPGIVVFVKYHYALLNFLRNYHNFTIKYRVARGWSGRLKSGYRLGVVGILARNEADVAATGIFQRINRHAEFDIIHQSWEFKSGFIYRITPELTNAAGGGDFFKPFGSSVWIALLLTLLLIVIVLKLSGTLLFKTFQNELNLSWAAYIAIVVGTLSQQGIPGIISPRFSLKVAYSSLLLLVLVVYNYYTSVVVGGLLSSPGSGPETVREIIDSPLIVSFRDIGYHKILFRETKVPIIRELYDIKVRPSREGKDLPPVYTDVVTIVPFLKRGGYAFHCEMTEAFQEIAYEFDANDICELRTAKGLFNDLRLMSFVLPKRSMYTEMFRITMMRIQEIGLVKRTLTIHKIEKPICQSGGRVHPVEFFGVSTAFFVLCGGMVLATVLLFAERMSIRNTKKAKHGSPMFKKRK